jgi:hypothetical protein
VSDKVVDDVEKIAIKFGYPKIPIYCDKRLDDALIELDEAWDRTTKRISRGENAWITIKETKVGELEWTLIYDNSEPLDDAFFKTLPQVEIADILMYVGDLINMWGSFSHMRTRYTKRKKPAQLAINACLLAEASRGVGRLRPIVLCQKVCSLQS